MITNLRLRIIILILALGCSWAIPLYADDVANLGPADTSSPRATLKSFLDAMNEIHDVIVSARFVDRTSPRQNAPVMRVLDCLDQSKMPEYQREEFAAEAALCLKEVLDRVQLPPFDEIPGEEQGRSSGESDEVARWRIPGTRIAIARVEEGPQRYEYLFTSGSVERAKEYFRDVQHLPYRTTGPQTSPGLYEWYISAPGNPVAASIVERLPAWTRIHIGGMAVWQWVAFCIATVIALLLMMLLYRVEWRIVEKYRDSSLVVYLFSILLPALAAYVPIGLGQFGFHFLTIRGTILNYLNFVLSGIGLLACVMIAFGLASRIAAAIIALPRINPQGLDAQFIRIMSRLLSIAASAVILIEGGSYLGIPVTTLLASAGIGGLAFALAAQDMLKNLFGTIMLLMDKPFRAKERIVFGKYDGVVEEIGLRSTRIRLLTGHLATIPNDELARADIENVTRRPFIRRSATIEFPSATPVAKLQRAVEIVKSVLENHQGMKETHPPRVYLKDLESSSVGLFFMYWYHPPEYWDFLEFSEGVNVAIIRQLEAEDIRFATPALTIDMAHRQGDDQVGTETAS